MSVIQIAILFLALLLCTISYIFFYIENRKQQKVHLATVTIYKNEILKNSQQIHKRQTHLSKYNFIQRNIEEALHVQTQIELYAKNLT